MSLYQWSQAAANNATADISCPFPEGQSPGSLNDGARGMMAAIACYRDDMSGQIVTAGTLTSYTVSSFQYFDSFADMNGKEIWFTPHVTNGATVVINVDGLGAKPIRSAPGVELPAGVMIKGTPVGAVYNNTDGAWYLKGFFGNPFNIPIGAGLEFWGTVTPNSNFAFADGSAISRATYAALFSTISTIYGAGDGLTTFNLPDKRGRVSVGIDIGAATGRLNGAYGGINAGILGSAGGAQSNTLATGNLPPYTPSGAVGTATSGSFPMQGFAQSGTETGAGASFGSNNGGPTSLPISVASSSTFTGNAQGGASVPFSNVQPSIACYHIIRIF